MHQIEKENHKFLTRLQKTTSTLDAFKMSQDRQKTLKKLNQLCKYPYILEPRNKSSESSRSNVYQTEQPKVVVKSSLLKSESSFSRLKSNLQPLRQSRHKLSQSTDDLKEVKEEKKELITVFKQEKKSKSPDKSATLAEGPPVSQFSSDPKVIALMHS